MIVHVPILIITITVTTVPTVIPICACLECHPSLDSYYSQKLNSPYILLDHQNNIAKCRISYQTIRATLPSAAYSSTHVFLVFLHNGPSWSQLQSQICCYPLNKTIFSFDFVFIFGFHNSSRKMSNLTEAFNDTMLDHTPYLYQQHKKLQRANCF